LRTRAGVVSVPATLRRSQWLGLHHSSREHIRQHAPAAVVEPWSAKDRSLFEGLTERLTSAAGGGDNLTDDDDSDSLVDPADAAAWLAEVQRIGQDRVKFDLEALAHSGMCIAEFVERKVLRREWL
jgi:hypothetical protein